MRHGFTESNEKKVWSCDPTFPDHITDEGKALVIEEITKFKTQKIDYILVSPFVRTKKQHKLLHLCLVFHLNVLLRMRD
jgi:hypothetical protein